MQGGALGEAGLVGGGGSLVSEGNSGGPRGSLVRGEAPKEIGVGDNWGEGSRVSKWTMAQDSGYPYC